MKIQARKSIKNKHARKGRAYWYSKRVRGVLNHDKNIRFRNRLKSYKTKYY